MARYDPHRGCRLVTYLGVLARNEVRTYLRAERRRKMGGGLYFFGLSEAPLKMLGKAAFSDRLGAVVNFPSTAQAIAALVPSFDQAVCASCKVRIFKECAGLPGQAISRNA